MVECIPVMTGSQSINYNINGKELFESVNVTVIDFASHFQKQHAWNNSNNSHKGMDTDNVNIIEDIEHFLYSRLLIVICVFGLLGNLLNILVLTRKGLQKTVCRMEKSVHASLIGLAMSDMIFCLLLLPHAWIERKGFYFSSQCFALFYKVYSSGLINIFIMSSTWMTVIMAASRYLAICHPLQARAVIGMTFAKTSGGLVFLFCILLNLPKFLMEKIDKMDCMEGWTVYYRAPGFLRRYPNIDRTYLWVYFTMGIFIPILVLSFCNLHLIKALRQANEMRKRYNQTMLHVDGTHRFTFTLIIIVIMYILLVTPAEMVNFMKVIVINNSTLTQRHNLIVAVVNTLQAVNFAFNYILYCIVNVHFRQTMREMWCQTNGKNTAQRVTEDQPMYNSLTATNSNVLVSRNNTNNITLL